MSSCVNFFLYLVESIVAKSKWPSFDDKEDVENGRCENPGDDEDSNEENLDRLAAVLASSDEDSNDGYDQEESGKNERNQCANCRCLKKRSYK